MTLGALRAKTASGLYYSFGSALLKKYATNLTSFSRISPVFLQLVYLLALMIAAKFGCYHSRDVATGTSFRHFCTFSV